MDRARRTVPLGIVIALMLSGIGVGGLTAYAVTTITISIPYNVTIAFSNVFQITGISMAGYDSLNNIYNQVVVTVLNVGSSSASGTVAIYFYDSGSTQIATGNTSTGTISAGASTTVTVGLTWVSGYNVGSLSSGRASVG